MSINTTMKLGEGLACTFHSPAALSGGDGDKLHRRLPPARPVAAYEVDVYPACPSHWKRGDARSRSYFVPVEPEHGMWLDLNACFGHTHDVAAMLSIQGINPITGRKVDGFGLEQYNDKCPVHDVPFQGGRHCKKCGYAWPKQSYICTTGTPNGLLWIDGFRAKDGEIRQYVFTKDKSRGVAAQLIGDDRAFAIGVAIYLSKTVKPPRPQSPLRGNDYIFAHQVKQSPWSIDNTLGFDDVPPDLLYQNTLGTHTTTTTSPDLIKYAGNDVKYGSKLISSSLSRNVEGKSMMKFASATGLNNLSSKDEAEYSCSSITKRKSPSAAVHAYTSQVQLKENLEIGAGARIEQNIYADPHGLDHWKDEPDVILYIQYATPGDVKRILEAGPRVEVAEGFMAGLKVGC